jgi:hypothetical protein
VGKDFTSFLYVSESGENYPETVLTANNKQQQNNNDYDSSSGDDNNHHQIIF